MKTGITASIGNTTKTMVAGMVEITMIIMATMIDRRNR